MNKARIWGGFLSLADFSQYVLRNLMGVTKDGSDIVAYHRFSVFDKLESFIDYTRQRGGLQAQARSSILVFKAGLGTSLSCEGDGFYSRHLLNPVALINREDT
jgi:hypothetical protein